ncbi:MAG: response regulator [Nanoarchaeota archaeon]|nr:response regulator [Nanoarchaeota archaeon]
MENKIQIEMKGGKKMEKLEILVIEDVPEFADVARGVYDADDRVNAHYAANYEEAMAMLEKKKYDGVVSDLFFPSETDFIKAFAGETDSSKSAFGEEYGRTYQDRFEKLDENPSGLAILQYGINHDIPTVVISQGDRHKGNLEVVRAVMGIHPLFSKQYQEGDPLSWMFVNGGREVDKNNPEMWENAVHGEYPSIDGIIGLKPEFGMSFRDRWT